MTGTAAALITRLTLSDFRNYRHLDIQFSARLSAFVGDNGAGKTNVLEAISFLTAGRGIRRAGLSDIARHAGSGGWSVAARLAGEFLETRIGTGFTPGEAGRKVRIDGADARSTEALLDHVRALWLVPSMDGLFLGPGSDRRRFLDRLTLSLDPAHGRRVGDFEKALRNRNKVLEQGAPDAYANAVETQVAELGTAVSLARRETTALLTSALSAQSKIANAFPSADVVLAGEFETEFEGAAASDIEDAYRTALQTTRRRDQAAGRTLFGPHLSDLKVHHREKQMPASKCSTGEQKALLIGLILGHAGLTKSMTGSPPVLLLDEVAAHLDPNRREALFEKLHAMGGQVFMTGTDAGLFEALPASGEIFSIDNSRARLLKSSNHP
ncbi:DNA replication and repair protein RecF [Roseibium hamelinense]|uniref:DNA replication and repair protein RecF n=1 Tax=Roseibium hamelinense TaxID=150831 RepID=A0A562T345_9HYPH|nr:DNA replication/repair protein RecF [Roseibium hamelinense]MTI44697.1 DNA replication/repair protein RecF [Roseibium hamelinense]TWI87326.1 DNA replication and repair protein RecF [Roseibium hamelinense]